MVDNSVFNISIPDVKKDLYQGIAECSARGLIHSGKWLAELNHGLDCPVNEATAVQQQTIKIDGIDEKEMDDYYLAKSYFDCREYDRSAYFTRNAESKVPKFLHLYATYMAKEKKRLDNTIDNTNLNQSGNLKDLADLLATLKALYNQRTMDGYMLYLYGVVLKKVDLTDLAITVFVESVHAAPTLWSSWIELTPLISDRGKLSSLDFPKHWMKHIFIAHTYLELFLNDEGLKMYEDLQTVGFKNCVYITSQIAVSHHNKRSMYLLHSNILINFQNVEFYLKPFFFVTDVDKAISIFKNLQKIDPYRLDNLDIFSNLLFVKELKKEMAFLAHKAVEIDKYRPETCCVIGRI